MLLAIDVGNTNTLFALTENGGEDWRAQWRFATQSARTADEYAAWLHQLFAMEDLDLSVVTGCVISQVVPQSLFNLRNLARRRFGIEPVVVGADGVEIGIEVRTAFPKQVGADRLVNAVGARLRYQGPLVIVDSGTATTFDVIAEDGAFEGGLIAPGINLSLAALHEAAANLPRIEIRAPERVIGKDTVSAMQSGVYWGYVELIDGLVRRVIEEFGQPMTVIGTGGVASLFEGASRTIAHFDQDLTIRGLAEIWRRNKAQGA